MVDLKELQNHVYQILKEFDRICNKYDIKYSLEGGTLLGAVKYRDFVPWDDDIDVIMLRDEYNKFLEVAQKELDIKFFLQSYNNVPEFPLNYAKLCLNNTHIYNYAYSYITSMNHGIFIDIFPIDNCLSQNPRLQCSMVGMFTSARKTKIKCISTGGIKGIIFKVLSLLPLKTLNACVTKQCTKYNNRKTDYRYEICNSNKNFVALKSEMYDEYVKLPFRDGEYWVVKSYDEFLKSRFGENYMNKLPPEEERKPSHCQNIIIGEIDWNEE